jgi:nicotinamidase/pyrazinamidase
MKRALKIGLAVVATLAVIAGAMLGFILYMSSPTQGLAIGTYEKPQRALLVVDIQEDYTGPHARNRFKDQERLIETTNRLLANADKLGLKVVYIRNEWSGFLMGLLSGGMNKPGAPGTQMDARLIRVPGGVELPKGRGDAFSNPELDAFLRDNQVNQLVVVGLDAAYCVKATTLGARNRGYRVTVVGDGVATESGTPLAVLYTAYTAAGANVVSSAELLR